MREESIQGLKQAVVPFIRCVMVGSASILGFHCRRPEVIQFNLKEFFKCFFFSMLNIF